MGGPGSGRWHRWDTRSTLDELLSLDIRLLKRRGYLVPGRTAGLSWVRGEQPAGALLVVGGQDAVGLVYRVQVGLGPWKTRRDRIGLTWTPCPLGGRRPWFLCPACQR